MREENENMSEGRSIISGYVDADRFQMGGPVRYDSGVPESAEPESTRVESIVSESYALREVVIKPLSSGYLVSVGCQSVAVETTENLLNALGKYLKNPAEFEKNWNANENRNKL